MSSRQGRRAAALAAALLAAACGGREPGTRVVLVTLDTLRYDAFAQDVDGLEAAMPRLRERADAGTVFTRFYTASSLTQPSHASMLTGRHPWEHGVTSNGHVLGEEALTVAEVLAEAGYETHAVVASFPVAARFGFSQGFDSYREQFGEHFMEMTRWEGHDVPGGGFFSGAEDITRAALEAVDAARGPRQFFWFHYFDPHAPYGSSQGGELEGPDVMAAIREGADPDDLLAEVRGLYRGDVGYLDQHLDRLLERLLGDDDFRTHVLLVADHGESLGEGGSLGHGYRLNRVELHVPAVLLSPGVRGARDTIVGSRDVAPTVLALAGVPAPPAVGGVDLARASGPGEAYGMRRTFQQPGTAEVRLDGRAYPLPDLFFYGVEPDGSIQRGNARGDRMGSDPDPAWRARFAEFEEALAERASQGDLDPGVSEILRSLGYVE